MTPKQKSIRSRLRLSGRKARLQTGTGKSARFRIVGDPRKVKRTVRKYSHIIRVNPDTRKHSRQLELQTAIALLQKYGWTKHDVNRAFDGLTLDDALDKAEHELARIRKIGRMDAVPLRNPGAGRGVKVNPARSRYRVNADPKGSNWQTFAGGTGAHHGNSYAWYIGREGRTMFSIDPPQRRGGPYTLRSFNVTAPHWADHGKFHSPQAAKAAASRILQDASAGRVLRDVPKFEKNPAREIITITGKKSGRVLGYATPETSRAELGRAALMLANQHSEPVKIERVKVNGTGSGPMIAAPAAVRQYLANPAAPRFSALAAASRRFSRFTGHKAERVKMMPFPKKPKAGLAVGPVLMLAYSATRDGKTENYAHKFAPHARPMLVSSDDGKALYLMGGRYTFTERGIVDTRPRR